MILLEPDLHEIGINDSHGDRGRLEEEEKGELSE